LEPTDNPSLAQKKTARKEELFPLKNHLISLPKKEK
jgi:hypothetical protein